MTLCVHSEEEEELRLQLVQNFVRVCVALQAVCTVTVQLPGSVDSLQLDAFLQHLLWDKNITNARGHAMDVYRVKVRDCSTFSATLWFHLVVVFCVCNDSYPEGVFWNPDIQQP
jgi:hypothetical protein